MVTVIDFRDFGCRTHVIIRSLPTRCTLCDTYAEIMDCESFTAVAP